jgi:cytochrome c oxidase subunit I
VKQAFGFAPEEQGPPPAVAASTMVLTINILGILLGAAVLLVSLVNLCTCPLSRSTHWLQRT